jgi:hypothetical protein
MMKKLPGDFFASKFSIGGLGLEERDSVPLEGRLFLHEEKLPPISLLCNCYC